MEVIQLSKDDVLLVRLPVVVSEDNKDKVRQQLTQQGIQSNTVVLDPEVELSVLKQEDNGHTPGVKNL